MTRNLCEDRAIHRRLLLDKDAT